MATTNKQDADFGMKFADQVVEWVSANMDPEDVFGLTRLERWAVANGFTRQE